MHDRIRFLFDDEIEKPLVFVGDIHVNESHGLAANAFPHVEAFTDARDRRQRFHLKVDVDLATAEVVHDHHIVILVCQIHRTRPAAEAVTT